MLPPYQHWDSRPTEKERERGANPKNSVQTDPIDPICQEHCDNCRKRVSHKTHSDERISNNLSDGQLNEDRAF
jgi:hypothetical protein